MTMLHNIASRLQMVVHKAFHRETVAAKSGKEAATGNNNSVPKVPSGSLCMQVLLLLIGITLAALLLRHCKEEQQLASISIVGNSDIDITPEEIRSIEAIGQWEFLAVACEEMVDTVRPRTFQRDDRLVRIYTGTLRLGLDLSQCEEGWVMVHGDTVSATLPRIRLLSDHFIDEARTRSFYESGTWDATAREAMYQQAARQMRRRALTDDNLRRAEANARTQMTALFRSFGFEHVELRFR